MFGFMFGAAGRVSRKGMWLFLLTCIAAHLAAAGADMGLSLEIGADGRGPVAMLTGLFLAWPSIAVPIKRFHDRGMSGWWVTLPFAILLIGLAVVLATGLAETLAGIAGGAATATPISGMTIGAGGVFVAVLGAAAVFQFVVLYCLPGVRGPNSYGDDPRGDAERFNPINLDRIYAKPKQADPHAPLPAARKLQPAVARDPDWGFGRVHSGPRRQSLA